MNKLAKEFKVNPFLLFLGIEFIILFIVFVNKFPISIKSTGSFISSTAIYIAILCIMYFLAKKILLKSTNNNFKDFKNLKLSYYLFFINPIASLIYAQAFGNSGLVNLSDIEKIINLFKSGEGVWIALLLLISISTLISHTIIMFKIYRKTFKIKF